MLDKKINSAIKLLKSVTCDEIELSYSGGKDSDVILELAKMGRNPKDGEFIQYVGHFSGVGLVQEMTGLYWLGKGELAQSIPPQYTRFIGHQIIQLLSKESTIK